MSWSTDTDKILSDGLQNTVVEVRSYTSTFASSSVYPTEGESVIATTTVSIYPKSGVFEKEMKGRVIKNTHLLFFPATSTVAVGYRVYETGETDYHEVMDVRDYQGHKQIYSVKVEGR